MSIEVVKEGEIVFSYEKSTQFRVIHVDGAFGGPAPGAASRLIHMAVFSERSPIPKRIVQEVRGGVLGSEIKEKREGKDGIFREVEADLVLSLDTAIALRDWLSVNIESLSSFMARNEPQVPASVPKDRAAKQKASAKAKKAGGRNGR